MPISRLRLIVLLGTVCTLGPLAIDMYLPVFPALAREFAAPIGTVQLTLSAFFMGIAAGQLFYGALADRFGRKPLLVFGIGLYILASAGCALAPDIRTLIALRVLQAIGGCAGMVICMAIVRDLFDAQDSARVISRLWLVFGLAPILAPSLGAWVVGVTSWRAIFWILVVVGCGCLLAVLRLLPETRPAQATRRAPILPSLWRDCGALARQRSFLGYAAAISLAHAGVLAYVTASPFVMIEVYGASPARFALLFALIALALVLGAQWNVHLLHRHAAASLLHRAMRWPVLIGVGLILLTSTPLGSLATVVALLFAMLAATAIIRPNGMACALAGNGERAGTAVALIGSLQFLLGTLSGTFMSVLHDGTARPMAITLTLLALAGLALYHWLVKETPA